ncbi:hypothetical protein MS3_00000627 [Schistosoma haematobium]|uniref:Uncharacterized protein n=1 Tax=Schistosoma haematobium TaxID=6185 RepID=A0A922IL01_SCHHA|nr:hypothetical protein MS3_00000627 [Schistosoma haematobium]KAH9581727.1 hypothetical protein MS3_00000627 [Schistosoma haematobium]
MNQLISHRSTKLIHRSSSRRTMFSPSAVCVADVDRYKLYVSSIEDAIPGGRRLRRLKRREREQTVIGMEMKENRSSTHRPFNRCHSTNDGRNQDGHQTNQELGNSRT